MKRKAGTPLPSYATPNESRADYPGDLAAERPSRSRPRWSRPISFALIIEDELLLAFSVEDALRHLDYKTFVIATSMQEAVEAASRRSPDLIIADHQITGGTGTDAVLAICSDKAVPVVFVTGSGKRVRERLPEALIVDKPFTASTLENAVSIAVARPFQRRPETD